MSIFKRWIGLLVGCGPTIIILDWIHDRPFLYSYNLLIGMFIGFSVVSAIAWLYEKEKGYFAQPEVQSNLRLREIDPQATRPWKEGWKEISQLKEKE